MKDIHQEDPNEDTKSNTSLSMLVDFYVADIQRRGCSPDAMITNRRALQRFARILAPKGKGSGWR